MMKKQMLSIALPCRTGIKTWQSYACKNSKWNKNISTLIKPLTASDPLLATTVLASSLDSIVFSSCTDKL